jgi:hypothetical protein
MEVLVLLAMLSVGVILAVAWHMHANWRREQTLRRGGCPRCGHDVPSLDTVRTKAARTKEDPPCTVCGWSRAESRQDARARLTLLEKLDDRLVYTACILLILAVVTLLTLATYARGRTGLW